MLQSIFPKFNPEKYMQVTAQSELPHVSEIANPLGF